MPLEAQVVFQELSFEKEAQTTQTKYKDVSGGGLLLHATHQCPLGTLLKLEIRVPGWGKHQKSSFEPSHELEQRPLTAVGQVVRIEALDDGEYELGVKFLNVYPEDLQALMALVHSSDQP
jgi:c-di-GMP-binding flagellar brake protein YcgR